MINTEEGRTRITGDSAEILADLTCICSAIKEAFEKRGKKAEDVKKRLHSCVDDAFKTDEELNDSIIEELAGLIKDILKGIEDDG